MPRSTVVRAALGATGFAVVIAAWWIAADTAFAVNGVVPSPPDLVRQIAEDGTGYYLAQIGVTLSSAGQGYLWGAGVALLLAVVVMVLPALSSPVGQLALFVECAPAAAIGPVVLAVVQGRTPSIFLAAIAVLFTTLVGALLGARATRRIEVDVIAVYGGNRWDLFRKVKLFAALPATVNALKIGIPAAILGAIIGEYLGGVDSGVGVALAVAQRSIQVERTWIFGLSAALVTSIGYALLSVLGRALLPWSAAARRLG
ncbi:ABC transporter permease [Microbacterium betulae]|uniref:ABC transporter permease n=1 Tax=Microbacterium betulae TaxID=2981139 RepID=A0AA97FHD6_9MICO|nr:ABC transporter permease subunit [Microbacterium sp. AB]WOF22119.1 ABC transporter permease [Microbacterium sp. AB]